MKPIARSGGRSAVASAAYRAAEKLTNERDGLVHDFRAKQGVEHTQILLPKGVDVQWAKDRSTLWNAAEFAEGRKDARVAREFEIALPHELSAVRRLGLTRAFARDLANRYGAAVDFAIHVPPAGTGLSSSVGATDAISATDVTGTGDIRNVHAHIMMTTRRITREGLGEKTVLERENKWLLSNGLPTSQMQLCDIRQSFEDMANEHLAQAGLDIRIDHRSHVERGLEIEPTQHMGVHAAQMDRLKKDVSRTRLDGGAGQRNFKTIQDKPEQVLALITAEKSVFDRHDVARILHRYVNDDVVGFQNIFAKVMACPALVELRPEQIDTANGGITLARYSTREMVEVETGLSDAARCMNQAKSHAVDRRHVDHAIERQNDAIQKNFQRNNAQRARQDQMPGDKLNQRLVAPGLSGEQEAAIRHVTGPGRIAVVVGYAGAGKSTMLSAAREAWQAQGFTVRGAALSGKAAEGLEESSGIRSRTLASWEMGWQNPHGSNRSQLSRDDVLVIDEAGMVGSRLLARFIGQAERAGAKIILVGDHEQLQAIGAGAPFRAIAERIGHTELSQIRRQRHDWQRDASKLFATHQTAGGLAAYYQRGDIRFNEDGTAARAELVRDYLADRECHPAATRVVMAHRRADVRALNSAIRAALQERGELAGSDESGAAEDRSVLGREIAFQTNDGKRNFARGDRVVFLENNRDFGIKNGTLGTVESVEYDRYGPGAGPMMHVLPDGRQNSVRVSMMEYQAIDHGYATTIHKNQGATVDRAFVLASATMDRHLTYVAMTRHRDSARLYVDGHEFIDRRAGRLVAHGRAPYEHNARNRDSYYVTLNTKGGRKHTVWGVDLERAMTQAALLTGAWIGLECTGSQTVQLPDGKIAQKNSWKVTGADELAFGQLQKRLSRSGAKETVLDYTCDFAGRRGIVMESGVHGHIEPDHGLAFSRKAAGGRTTQAIELKGEDSVLKNPAVDLAPDWAQRAREAREPDDHCITRPEATGPAPAGITAGQRERDPEAQDPHARSGPLIPAITRYDRSIEDIAREKALPVFDQDWRAVETMAGLVYRNPGETTSSLRAAAIAREGHGEVIGEQLANKPEQFGELRGKAGILGDNKERRQARQHARSLAEHVNSSIRTWQRRLGEERQAEEWQRINRDCVAVPDLTPQSAEILAQVDAIPTAERNSWIDQLRSTQQGMTALKEAEAIGQALHRRFGRTDPRDFDMALERHPGLSRQAGHIRSVARIVERTCLAEMTRDYTLRQELTKSKGLGLSR